MPVHFCVSPWLMIPLLEVDALQVVYPGPRDLWGRSRNTVNAVNGVSLTVAPGEALGLVGESGCGKTTLGRAILRLVEPSSGRVLFQGEDWLQLSPSELRGRRRHAQMIFQDPNSSLNPRLTVGASLGEALEIHHLANGRAGRLARIRELLAWVGLPEGSEKRYPHEFSGGQRQRIGIARALAVEPKLIVCDEPVSALDVSVQAQIVNLLQELQGARRLAYLFISHDLAVVEHLCARIAVMYLGRLVEVGPARDVCRTPAHPYTQALVSAVPQLHSDGVPRIQLRGDPPSPVTPPSGCPFHPRCPVAEARCRTERPLLRVIGQDRQVACHLAV